MSKNFNVRGKLTVTVHSARELPVKQMIGEMDPFCKFEVKGEKFKTPVAENGHRAPKWEYSFICNLDGDEDAIHLKVYNKGNVTDDLMSRADIELPNLNLSGKPEWYSLRDPDNFQKMCGEISMSLVFEGTGLPLASKALTTHTARTAPTTPGGPAIVPVSPQQYQSQPPPQYATQPQYPPQQQPGYPPQQQFQQQPQYPPQPVYQQPQPVYQQPQPVYQQPQPVYQPPQPQYAPLTPVYQAPQPQVIVVQQQPAPSLFGSVMGGINSLANQATQAVQSIVASAPAYKGKWDNEGYLQLHPDVRAANMEGFSHYEKWGHNEGRVIALTNGLRGKFDPAGYHALHPDVKNANMASWDHFRQWGKNENRDVAVIPQSASGKFDKAGYLTLHPDVKAAGMDAWDHYLRYGHGEKRRITVNTNGTTWSGTFNGPAYVNNYPDLIAAKVDGWDHFHKYGFNEQRTIVVNF